MSDYALLKGKHSIIQGLIASTEAREVSWSRCGDANFATRWCGSAVHVTGDYMPTPGEVKVRNPSTYIVIDEKQLAMAYMALFRLVSNLFSPYPTRLPDAAQLAREACERKQRELQEINALLGISPVAVAA